MENSVNVYFESESQWYIYGISNPFFSVFEVLIDEKQG
jgi:hypothetical protein